MLKVITISLVLSLTNAWWENGHMLVSQIAEIILQKDHPNVYERANDIVHSMGSLAYDIDNTFVTAAVWADDIKDNAMDFWNNWHFYGRPVNPTGMYLMQDVTQSQSNAVDALRRAQIELDDSKSSQITMQKAFFLRFVLHIVGDVHQPLHSVHMYNQTYNGPNGDLGGNLEQIYDVNGEKLNFHSFWDQGAEYFQKSGKNWIQRPFNESTTILMREWAQELMDLYPVDYFGDLSNNLDPEEWTRESWEISENFTYPLIYTTNKLTQAYQDQAQEICKQRVVLGGYRLANTLIKLYKDYVPKNQKPAGNTEKQDLKSDKYQSPLTNMAQLTQFLHNQNKKYQNKN